MAIYGKLTQNRVGYTATELNNSYDLAIQRLISILPSDKKYPNGYGINSVYDNVELKESDPMSAQIVDINTVTEAAKTKIRQWLRVNNFLCVTSTIEPVADSDLEYIEDMTIKDVNDIVSIKIQDMLAPQVADDPRIIGDIYSAGNYSFGKYFDEFVYGMMDQFRAWIQTGTYYPYPIDVTQNIYNNMYQQADREYSNIAVQSKVPSSVFGYETMMINASSQRGLRIKSDESNLINTGTAYQSTPSLRDASALLNVASFAPNGQPISNHQPLSNTGQQEQQFSFGEGNSAPFIKGIGNSILKGLNNSNSFAAQQFTIQGNPRKVSAVIKKVMPLSKSGVIGNAITSDQEEQQVATVTTVINANGKSANIDPNLESQQLVYNGFVKLRKAPRSALSRPLGISKLQFHSGGVGTTMIVEQLYSSNTGTGFIQTGSLGTETFDDEGYDSWCIGAGTTLFTMNIDSDVGYNGFAAGTSYQYGHIEEFDSGWTEGASPFSRKDNNREYAEDLTTLINGSRTTFDTTYNFAQGSLRVFWNGQAQIEGNTFTVSSNLKSFTTTFTASGSDVLEVEYTRFYRTDSNDFKYKASTLRLLKY